MGFHCGLGGQRVWPANLAAPPALPPGDMLLERRLEHPPVLLEKGKHQKITSLRQAAAGLFANVNYVKCFEKAPLPAPWAARREGLQSQLCRARPIPSEPGCSV